MNKLCMLISSQNSISVSFLIRTTYFLRGLTISITGQNIAFVVNHENII